MALVIAPVKRSYFLTYLVPATLSETEVKTHQEAVQALIKKHKGTVLNLENWGKKYMAYKIKHSGKWHTEAFYTHFTLEFDPANITAFEKDIYLQGQIMRHLLVVTEGKAEKSAE